MAHTSETYADKIAKLLAKAESTTPEEAELLMAKAQELMTTYAIDEAMIAAAGTMKAEREQLVTESVLYHSTYSRALFEIGYRIALANDCKGMVHKGHSLMKTTLYIVGYESDVRRAKMLDTSLQIQAMAALLVWWKDQPAYDLTEREKFKMRRQFLFSFATGMGQKLKEASRAGKEQAIKNETERSGEDASESVALVLRSKAENVQAYLDRVSGGRSRGSRFASGGQAAREAGHEAGRNSNTGQPSVGNSTARLTS